MSKYLKSSFRKQLFFNRQIKRFIGFEMDWKIHIKSFPIKKFGAIRFNNPERGDKLDVGCCWIKCSLSLISIKIKLWLRFYFSWNIFSCSTRFELHFSD